MKRSTNECADHGSWTAGAGSGRAADDVAAALAVAAVGAPVDGTVELAGPGRLRFDELTGRVLGANGDARRVTADRRARYFG